jgi:hypothetical protein
VGGDVVVEFVIAVRLEAEVLELTSDGCKSCLIDRGERSHEGRGEIRKRSDGKRSGHAKNEISGKRIKMAGMNVGALRTAYQRLVLLSGSRKDDSYCGSDIVFHPQSDPARRHIPEAEIYA